MTQAGAERRSAFQFAMRYTAVVVPVSQRYFAPGQLQFITSSVYCRLKLFDSPRLRGGFVEELRERGQEAIARTLDRLPARFPKQVSASIRDGFLRRLELIERS